MDVVVGVGVDVDVDVDVDVMSDDGMRLKPVSEPLDARGQVSTTMHHAVEEIFRPSSQASRLLHQVSDTAKGPSWLSQWQMAVRRQTDRHLYLCRV